MEEQETRLFEGGGGNEESEEDGVEPGFHPGGARPKQYSNVIVDDSPLQNQMQKNKECKSEKCDTKLRFPTGEILYSKHDQNSMNYLVKETLKYVIYCIIGHQFIVVDLN